MEDRTLRSSSLPTSSLQFAVVISFEKPGRDRDKKGEKRSGELGLAELANSINGVNFELSKLSSYRDLGLSTFVDSIHEDNVNPGDDSKGLWENRIGFWFLEFQFFQVG